MTQQQLGLFNHLTYKANLKHTRYGWLRLTPAYSVHLVEDLLNTIGSKDTVVLDPFCGTGTTALVCAERGIESDTTDINPFLLWLTSAKMQHYQGDDLTGFRTASDKIARAMTIRMKGSIWTPPIHQIEKWWDEDTLYTLGQIAHAIRHMEGLISTKTLDLLKISFCRTLITHSNASFNHQSMSFKKQQTASLFKTAAESVAITWEAATSDVYRAAQSPIRSLPRAILCDARRLSDSLPHNYYTCIITSPPYPNRMSYVRELRPYMYWMGYLNDGREAGELDWQAIGGTWGVATSNVGKWVPPVKRTIPYRRFTEIVGGIAAQSDVLSRYVHKYFYDMVDHVNELFAVCKSGATINYIVGNSKFYDVLLPVEEIFASLFKATGFTDVKIKTIRKRTSKRELYEYIVSAAKP